MKFGIVELLKSLRLFVTPSGNYAEVKAPAAIDASYSLSLPPALPPGLRPLFSDAAGLLTFRSLVAADIPSLDASKITSGALLLSRGGTGSSTKNFIDLTTDQSVAGIKTFTSSISAATPPNNDRSTKLASTSWYWDNTPYLTATTNPLVPHAIGYQIGSNAYVLGKQQGGSTVTDYPRLPDSGWYRFNYNLSITGSDYQYLLLIIQQLNAAGNGWNSIGTVLQVNSNGNTFSNPAYSGSIDLPITWASQDKIVVWYVQQNNVALASRNVGLTFSIQKISF